MFYINREFVELKDYPNYFISRDGILLRKRKDGYKLCSQTTHSNTDAYWSVTVYTATGVRKKRNMHRLLMSTFVPNPESKAHVNHIDGDKSNNALSNLEWATPSENAIHAVNCKLTTYKNKYVEIHQYSLQGVYLASYKSSVFACKSTGVAKQNISKCTLGVREHAGGFMWSATFEPSLPPLGYKVLKGFEITYSSGDIKFYRYLGQAYKNNNPKKPHPLLKIMGDDDILHYCGNTIKRIYYN